MNLNLYVGCHEANQPTSQPANQPTSQPVFAQFVTALLGMLLLAAACLKLYGMSFSPVPSVGWMSLPSIQLVVVLAEILLGSCLLFGLAKPFTWLVSLITFSTFAVVSGYFGYIGQASCGCFGVIKASPWVVFTIDILAVLALLAIKPGQSAWEEARTRHVFIRCSLILGGSVFLLSSVALGSSLKYGSVSAAIAKLRGEALGAPHYVDFGSVKAGEPAHKQIEITNYTNKPIRLIGGTSDCSCVTTTSVPLTIPAGETATINIVLFVRSDSNGTFNRTAELWTDCDEHRTVQLHLGCQID
jgi:uncharacterized membrane protein YphA (DoxX/SURF4 family)